MHVCPHCLHEVLPDEDDCEVCGAEAPETGWGGDPYVGGWIAGRYQVSERLGSGGMGVVYRAHEASLDRDVAVKILRPELATPGYRRRFEREAKAAARMTSGRAASILDFGELPDRTLYLVMEFVRGEPLDEWIDGGRRATPMQVVEVMRQIAEALAEAHQIGIVHRDVKPSNVLVEERSGGMYARLLDFGIAAIAGPAEQTRLTRTGMVQGTPRYMAPEQAMGRRDVDARTDLYALGVIAHEMIRGHPIFDGETPMQVMLAQIETEPPSLSEDAALSVSAELADLIERLLAKDPDHRPASAEAVLEELANVPGEAMGAPSPSDTMPDAAPPASAALGRAASGGAASSVEAEARPGEADAAARTGAGEAGGGGRPTTLQRVGLSFARRAWSLAAAVLLLGAGAGLGLYVDGGRSGSEAGTVTRSQAGAKFERPSRAEARAQRGARGRGGGGASARPAGQPGAADGASRTERPEGAPEGSGEAPRAGGKAASERPDDRARPGSRMSTPRTRGRHEGGSSRGRAGAASRSGGASSTPDRLPGPVRELHGSGGGWRFVVRHHPPRPEPGERTRFRVRVFHDDVCLPVERLRMTPFHYVGHDEQTGVHVHARGTETVAFGTRFERPGKHHLRFVATPRGSERAPAIRCDICVGRHDEHCPEVAPSCRVEELR